MKPVMVKTGIALLLALGFAIVVSYKYMYPFGQRSSTLPCLYGALFAYAVEHNGNFPDSGTNAYEALQRLYPDYTPSGIEFAGISGNIDNLVNALRSKARLSQSLTSLVYIPGLNQNDPPNLALFWESQAGLYPNGRRNFFGGHAVMLVGGTVTNVAAADWASFLNWQEHLRKAALAKRVGQTNIPPRRANSALSGRNQLSIT